MPKAQSPYELFLTRFSDFTDIQKLAMGPIEQGINCILAAPTGSGKTEAAILPVLNRILKSGRTDGIQAIYVTPLRALNRDLIKRLEWLGSELDIRIAVRHGDTPQGERRKQSLKPPQMLITTPETLQNLLISKNMRGSLKNLRIMIIDELHELYYNKRGAQLSVALERIDELSRNFQRVCISATIGDMEEAARFAFGGREHRIITSGIRKPLDITVEMPVKPENDDREFRNAFGLDRAAFARIERVAALIKGSSATIVFANTRQAVESLGSKLIQFGKSGSLGRVGIHHSSIDKEERIATENAFKKGEIKAIIATSSLELGIDVGEVNLVVQYGSPRQATRLIQRVGRGGHRERIASVGNVIVHNELDCLETIAITDSALGLRLERHRVERNALDVLANQIVAMTMEYGRIGKGKAFGIVARSYTYAELKIGEFDRVCTLLSDLRLIRIDGDDILYSPRGRGYFIGAISVIPSTTRFVVKEAMENRIISTLDEEFVYSYIEEGAVFITKGLPWKVVSIGDDVIYVEPSDDIAAAVPDWDGEEIPVSKDIAAAVWDCLISGTVPGNVKLEPDTGSRILSFLKENLEYFSGKEDRIVIEELENSAVAYLPLGKLANEFLSRIISVIASSQAGAKVNAKATPYAIILDYSGVLKRPDTEKVFRILKNIDVENRSFVLDSDLFRYKFIQSAKLFGVAAKDAAVTKSMASRIISFYENSPIFDETARNLYKNYFDIEVAKRFISGLGDGTIKVELCRKATSPLAKVMLQSSFKYGELLATNERESVIDRMFDKFDGREAKLICTYCSHVFNGKVDLKSNARILCTSCRSPLAVTYNEGYERLIRKREAGERFTEKDNGLYREMMRVASLIDAYGYRAVVAMSVYGIGIETAVRLLKYIRSDYKMFFVDVIEAQKNFIKNRRFWKID